MAIEIILAKDDYSVKSGERVFIQAEVKGWARDKEKKLIWGANKGNIERGYYQAPVVREDTMDQVVVKCVEDETVYRIINICIKKTTDHATYIKKLDYNKIGKDGEYSINFQVVNDEGKGAPCIIVLTDRDRNFPPILPDGKYCQVANIDALGFFSIDLLPFTEKKRVLYAQIKDTDITDMEIELKGPRKKIQFYPTGGFWKNLIQNQEEEEK